MKNDRELIFALDIGTRSVVGILAKVTGENVQIVHTASEEHHNRAMLDGQIHDVEQVAGVVSRIKERFESKIGFPLQEVAVAAAGRALITLNGKATRQFPVIRELTTEDVFGFELAAVQDAERQLNNREEEIDATQESNGVCHCVGYSVIRAYLDGQVIGNLVGQRAKTAEVEVIATFLPRVVVDSLFSVLNRVNLKVKSLTLEPIAASNVAITPNMRQLNLALVDIGAGTSDIALTAGNTIQAYAMVPVAGDEVTDQICQQFLLEFEEGERVKCVLQQLIADGADDDFSEANIVACDILGLEQKLLVSTLLATITPIVEQLAGQVADKILSLNGKCPQAVILVGGGSLTPLLPVKIADRLGLPKERVGVKGRESLHGLTGNLADMNGPEFVTPVGIAVTAIKNQSPGYYEVTVNGQPVRLFNGQLGTVGDALVAARVSLKQIHGLPGLAKTVEVNGQVKILRGTLGEPAAIIINGIEAKLDSAVKPGDEIRFHAAKSGKNATGMVKDILPFLKLLPVVVNGREFVAAPVVTMNGKPVSLDTPFVDGARICYREIETVEQLLAATGDLAKIKDTYWFSYFLNGTEKTVPLATPAVCLNGEQVSLASSVQAGDQIVFQLSDKPSLKLNEIVDINRWQGESITVDVNGEVWTLPGKPAVLCLNGEKATGEEPICQGDRIEVQTGHSADLIVSELLYQINFQPVPPEGKNRLEIVVNGLFAEYTTPVPNDARVELTWQ